MAIVSAEKWLVMVLIFVISLLLGLIPYFILPKVKSWSTIMSNSRYHLVVSILSCIGAGVLLSTAALHMLPENRESLSGITEIWENLDEHFPLAEVLMLSGLAIIYLIEEFAEFILADHSHSGNDTPHPHHHHHHHMIARHSSIAHGIPIPIPGGPRPSILSRNGSICTTMSNYESNFNLPRGSNVDNSLSVKVISNSQQQQKEKEKDQHSTCNHSNSFQVDGKTSNGNTKIEKYNDELIVYEEPVEDERSSSLGSKLRSVLAVLALSFHAIMEGIAIGIENSSNVWFMFGAIAGHKFVISFCMGMELCASKAKLSAILSSVFIFSILSPIGIFIGSYMSEGDEPNGLAVSIIQGFATGTIFYVIFFEILNRERERKSGGLKSIRYAGFIQFISLAIGLAGMASLLILMPHEHGHSEEEHDDHDHDHDHRHLLKYTALFRR